ncbi:MBL fold metallo-hydrolase [Rhodobacterales bacterium HKCCE2091]|nr:MBL fold metallo-hydrolase [Rhodobacterales bacterium HKCCE2091]
MEELEPGLRRLRAPNASPMTHSGTNTYLLGTTGLAVIDPGPDDPAHLDAILSAVAPGQHVAAILVTHSHLDHSPLARSLSRVTGAPVLAAGDSGFGRSARMEALARAGLIGGGEGVDADFVPDRRLAHGEVVQGPGWRVEALATPGHMANHLAFAWNGAVFTGDVVMGWSTSVVSPPDGDMTAFYATLDLLSARDDRVYYPGHGDPVETPAARVAELRDHRRARETAILDALAAGPADAATLAARIYTDTDPRLMPMATRNVLAHLLDLEARNFAHAEPPLTPDSRFELPT